tara:strand:+ start:163 stop:336 length:174 start_codon:yes stop_codon:yes gene_type:complete
LLSLVQDVEDEELAFVFTSYVHFVLPIVIAVELEEDIAVSSVLVSVVHVVDVEDIIY